ncbi:hypothetical protein NKG94_09550 [Micromonospora sp. M12]
MVLVLGGAPAVRGGRAGLDVPGTVADAPALVTQRGSGWRGVGWLVLGSVGISLLVFAARVVLGPTVVPG